MDFEKQKLHLELVQNVITRMNSNSFAIKGWVITLVTAIYGLAISTSNKSILYLSIFVTLTFWGLDGYYLYQERLYRKLYDYVRLEGTSTDFNLNASIYKGAGRTWFGSTFSITMLVLYLSILVVTVILIATVKYK